MSTPEPPQYPAPPAAPYQPAPQVAAATPGKGLSIAAIILAVLMPLIGLILGIIAMVQSKKAGRKNGLALAAIIVSVVLMVIGVISAIMIIGSMAALGGNVMEAVEACQSGASSVMVAGQTVSCDEILSSVQ